MEQVRLGIIGVGNMGSGHTANIMAGKVPEVRITAAADLRESRREWACPRCPSSEPRCRNCPTGDRRHFSKP